MDALDDENPFENEGSHYVPPPPPTTHFNDPESSSPPPQSPPQPRPALSTNPSRAPQSNVKAEFCCQRDQWLHSGEDVEIVVCNPRCEYGFRVLIANVLQIVDAQKTQVNASSPYITYVIRAGVCLFITSDHHDTKLCTRTPRDGTDTPSSSRSDST
jgi:hypothetical protein